MNVIVWLAGSTVWLTEPELPLWLASPEYVAATVSDPPPRLLVVHVATPGYVPDNVLAAHPVFALQVTVPVGCIGRIPFLPGFRPFTSPVSARDRRRERYRPTIRRWIQARGNGCGRWFAPVMVKLPVSGLLDAE